MISRTLGFKKMLNSSIETTQSKKATHCMFIISENTRKNYYLPKTNIVFHTLCSARNSKKKTMQEIEIHRALF